MKANFGWFGSKMATGYFQDLLSVLEFYSHLIGIKYGLDLSNQVEIKMLFNKELIYLKIYIYEKAFLGQNVDKTWFINAGFKIWW